MKFRASKCHKEAVLTIIILPKTTADIGETLSNAVRQEKYERRQVLLLLLDKLKLLTHEERDLLSQVVILARLMLVVPATNAISEHSFSSLHRVKTYLRSTMNQDRLNQFDDAECAQDIDRQVESN